MENVKYLVYMHIFPNKKKYIGITMQNPKVRWQGGTGYKRTHQPRIYNAIQKYGWRNIEHKIIKEGLTRDEACKLEVELILKYKTTEREYGYNILIGGDVITNPYRKLSEATKKKISESMKGAKNPNYGKPAWNRGKRCPKDVRNKIGEGNRGLKKKGRAVIGINIITNKRVKFKSMAEAGRVLNIGSMGIWNCCNNKAKTAGDYEWQYV